MELIAVTVFFKIGSREYKNTASITVFEPIPNPSIKIASSARDGIVCKTLANPIITSDKLYLLDMKNQEVSQQ